MDEHPTVEVKLTDLAHDDWFQDKTTSTFWLRLYVSGNGPFDAISQAYHLGLEHARLEDEFKITYLHLEAATTKQMLHNSIVLKSGDIQYNVEVKDFSIAKSNYIAITTPHKVDDGPSSEVRTRRRLDRLAALLRAHLGSNALHELAHEGEYRADTGNWATLSGPSFKGMSPVQGPFLHPQNWIDISEIYNKVKSLEHERERQHRIYLALDYLYKGMEGSDFYNYWTSIEIVVAGRGTAIGQKLLGMYPALKNAQEAERRTGVAILKRWRHEMIHKGKRVFLSTDVERFIQLLFLDIVGHELWLPGRHHAVSFARQSGVDLSVIGLGDNRTEEQRRQAEQELSSPPPSPSEEERRARIERRRERWKRRVDEWKRAMQA